MAAAYSDVQYFLTTDIYVYWRRSPELGVLFFSALSTNLYISIDKTDKIIHCVYLADILQTPRGRGKLERV